jgi:GxxExxY protein
LTLKSQFPFSPLNYRGLYLGKDYIIALLVEDEIILEIKAVEDILPVHKTQLISYRKLAGKRLGFLINFNVTPLKYGFKGFVNNSKNISPRLCG